MGVMHHHIAVATSWRDDDVQVKQAWERVVSFAKEQADEVLGTDFTQLLIGPVPGVMNGYVNYLMIPDGSKEGWDTSGRANAIRDKFVAELGECISVEVFVGSWGEKATTGSFVNGGDESYLA